MQPLHPLSFGLVLTNCAASLSLLLQRIKKLRRLNKVSAVVTPIAFGKSGRHIQCFRLRAGKGQSVTAAGSGDLDCFGNQPVGNNRAQPKTNR